MGGFLMRTLMRQRYVLFLLISALFLSIATLAEPVQIIRAELKLNGNLIAAKDKQQTAFLILHGTWAHAAMELPATLQGLLENEGYASLAITLSLGVNDRQGFFDCKSSVVQGHEAAIDELHAWYLFLREQGYSKVVLMAHSRGGAQAALYQQRYPQDKLTALVLLAPMTWQKGVEAKTYHDKYGVNLNDLLTQAGQYRQSGKALFTPPGILYCKKTPVSPHAFISYYSALPGKNTPALLADRAIPAIVYLGSEDPLSTGFAKQQGLFSNKNNITVVSIDDAGHFFRDFYADELIEDILQRLP